MVNTNEIKATVTFNWNHKNCRFLPGDKAMVIVDSRHGAPRFGGAGGQSSNKAAKKQGQVGTVVAVSCCSNGKIRSNTREFTRYYVEFQDKSVFGFHSHLLNKVG